MRGGGGGLREGGGKGKEGKERWEAWEGGKGGGGGGQGGKLGGCGRDKCKRVKGLLEQIRSEDQ